MSNLYQECLKIRLYESSEERADDLKFANKNIGNCIELIISDLQGIQLICSSLREAAVEQKLAHCIKSINEDIEIIERHTNKESAIWFQVNGSNKQMVRLAGYIVSTREEMISAGISTSGLDNCIKRLKKAIHDFNGYSDIELYGILRSIKIWRLYTSEKQKRILHDIDVKAEKEFGELLKD